MIRMLDFSSPNVVFRKGVKSLHNPRLHRRASLKLKAVHLSLQLRSPEVAPRASKRLNERFDLLFFSTVVTFVFLPQPVNVL